MRGSGLDSKQVLDEPCQFLKKHFLSLCMLEKQQSSQMAFLEVPHWAFDLQ